MRNAIVAAALLLATGITRSVFAAEYYLDDVGGNDQADGKTVATAWKTLAALKKVTLAAGDTVRFKAGGKWDAAVWGSNGILVTASGTAQAPITFTRYGSGDAPIVENSTTSTKWVRSFTLQGSQIVIDGLLLQKSFETGITIDASASEILVQNCEFVDLGIAAVVRGKNVVVTHNYFHDLHMVNNTPGGDDDYGAVAVGIINGSNVEVAFNRMQRCVAPSYDYQQDGGAVELYAETSSTVIDAIFVHGNIAFDGEGFMEIGGQGGTIKGVRLAYNVSSGNRSFNVLHTSGTFGVNLESFEVENNTIVELGSYWNIVYSSTALTETQYLFRNNLVVLGDYQNVFSQTSPGTHDHNLFDFKSATTKLGATATADEIFQESALVDLNQRDFHLTPQSPALDRATDVGLSEDAEQNPVPYGSAPDIGAFEWRPPGTSSGGSDAGGGTAGAASGGTSGKPSSGGAPGGGTGAASGAGPDAGTHKASSADDSSACGCRAAGLPRRVGIPFELMGLVFLFRRFRAQRGAR